VKKADTEKAIAMSARISINFETKTSQVQEVPIAQPRPQFTGLQRPTGKCEREFLPDGTYVNWMELLSTWAGRDHH